MAPAARRAGSGEGWPRPLRKRERERGLEGRTRSPPAGIPRSVRPWPPPEHLPVGRDLACFPPIPVPGLRVVPSPSLSRPRGCKTKMTRVRV